MIDLQPQNGTIYRRDEEQPRQKQPEQDFLVDKSALVANAVSESALAPSATFLVVASESLIS
jgi:hypothetical protein